MEKGPADRAVTSDCHPTQAHRMNPPAIALPEVGRLRPHRVLWVLLLALNAITGLCAQSPQVEDGIWAGTLVVRRSQDEIGVRSSSTFQIKGYVVAGRFEGIIVNLDNRDALEDPYVVSQRVRLNLGQALGSGLPLVDFELGAATQPPLRLEFGSLQAPLRQGELKLKTMQFRLSEYLRSGNPVARIDTVFVEVSVKLSWRKALPPT
jgi:hypothetical protein